MFIKHSLCLILSLSVLSILVVPASSISVSCTSGGGGSTASFSMGYDLDDSTSLRSEAILNSGSIIQKSQASGSGQNTINQQVGGGDSSVGNAILSNGAFSASTSATASPEGAGIQQQVAAAGDASVSLSGTKGASSAGQEADVVGGVISGSQSVSASASSGVASSQSTEISGMAGMVGSGAISEDGAMVANGNFLGAGILKAELSSTTTGDVKLSGGVATDGFTWMDDEDLQQVAENGGGVAVHGLRAVPGGMGTFDMNAVSLDAGALADMGQVVTQALGGSSTSYALTGYRWNTLNPKVQLYLKDDSNLQGRGLTGTEVQTAITNAANTWDDAVSQNLFADGSTVIIDPNKNTDNIYDGYNVLAWKYLSDAPSALAYTRTRYGYPAVDGYWTTIESDVSFNTAFPWTTTSTDGTPYNSGDPIDVQTVALHELGHTIGLGDLYTLPDGDVRKSDFSQVMNKYNDVQRTLGNGDRTVAQKLYGRLGKITLRAYNGQYVCAENGGGGELVANRNGINGWDSFNLIDFGNNKVALQADNGQYVCAENGGGRELVANRNWVNGWETFSLINLGNNRVALQAYNGQYVCAENGGGRELVANRNWVNGWETFSLIDYGIDKVALQAYNGQYVCAENGGGREVVANRNEISGWETFNLINLGNNMVALQAYNGQYVCAENGGGREVVANRNEISGWETFSLIDLGNNKIALQAYNGQHVCAENGGGREVVANRNWINGWETFNRIYLS